MGGKLFVMIFIPTGQNFCLDGIVSFQFKERSKDLFVNLVLSFCVPILQKLFVKAT